MNNKTAQIVLRVSPQLKEAIAKAAKADRREASDWMRLRLEAALESEHDDHCKWCFGTTELKRVKAKRVRA